MAQLRPLTFCLLMAPALAGAEWTATVDYSACPAKYLSGGGSQGGFSSESECRAYLSGGAFQRYACAKYDCVDGGGSSGSGAGSGPDTSGIQSSVEGAKQAVQQLLNRPQDAGADLLADEDTAQSRARYGLGRPRLDPDQKSLGDGPMESLLLKLQPWCERRFPAKPGPADRSRAVQDLKKLDSLLAQARERLEAAEMNFNQRQRARLRIECAEAARERLHSLSQVPPTPAPTPRPAPDGLVGRWLAYADRMGFDEKEKERLRLGLDAMVGQGREDATLDEAAAAWTAIRARAGKELRALDAAAAAAPGGAEIFRAGAGRQGGYNDCTLWALANATGTPYGVVTAQAGELFDQADWREGRRLGAVVGSGGRGLMNGEVVLLTESLGQAKTVERDAFADHLAQGRAVMVGLVAPGAKSWDQGHQVVLTRSFEHGGRRWYQMMDSNDGPLARRYVRAEELDTVLLNAGVVYEPESGRTPRPLR